MLETRPMPRFHEVCPTCGGDGQVNKLSAREMQILQLISGGKTVKEIACLLDISVKTVEAHKYTMMRKTGTHSSVEVLRFAIENGFTTVERKVQTSASVENGTTAMP
jgi:DNA-binding CsgD family transcriptional regulator